MIIKETWEKELNLQDFMNKCIMSLNLRKKSCIALEEWPHIVIADDAKFMDCHFNISNTNFLLIIFLILNNIYYFYEISIFYIFILLKLVLICFINQF